MDKNMYYIDFESCYPYLDDLNIDHYISENNTHFIYSNIPDKKYINYHTDDTLNHIKMDCIYTIQRYYNTTKNIEIHHYDEIYKCEEVDSEFLKKMIHLEFKKYNLEHIYRYKLPQLFNILNNIYTLFSIYENYGKDSKKTITIEQFNNLENIDDPDESCTICSDKMHSNNIKLKCGHIFHKECIYQWLLNYSDCCPYCKIKTN